jgi:hypothetical protein
MSFQSLSGELRNRIYRAHFDGLYGINLPKNEHNYVCATAVRPFLNLFEVSKEIYNETHGLFFAEYFPRNRYTLEGLRAIQAFANLPSDWKRHSHALEVRSEDADVGLQYLHTINAVLEGTSGLGHPEQLVIVSFQHSVKPLLPCDIAFTRSWDKDWRSLARFCRRTPFMISFPEGRDARGRHVPLAFMKATIRRTLSNLDVLYRIRLKVIVDSVGDTKWQLRGRLMMLDWSHVPEDLRVFVDKPSGVGTTDEAAKAIAIIKGLEIKE